MKSKILTIIFILFTIGSIGCKKWHYDVLNGKYEGEKKYWLFGLPDGQGTFTYEDDLLGTVRYVGEWKNGSPYGHGVQTFSRMGQKLEGTFSGTIKEGTLTLANGTKYVGEFYINRPNGKGIMYYPNGTIKHNGKWEMGKYVGR